MEGLTAEARAVLEKNIDSVLEKPEEREEIYSSTLKEHGIEPNLETILSFITGFLTGLMAQFYVSKYGRFLNADEIGELTELMKRRAFEIRMAFMGTRIEK